MSGTQASGERTGGSLLAHVVANLTLPAAWMASNLVSWWLKSSNPDGVDVTQGLAYLREILLSGVITAGLVAAAGLVLALGRRKAGDGMPLKL